MLLPHQPHLHPADLLGFRLAQHAAYSMNALRACEQLNNSRIEGQQPGTENGRVKREGLRAIQIGDYQTRDSRGVPNAVAVLA